MSKRARKCNFGEETKKINVDTFHPSFSLKCAKMSVKRKRMIFESFCKYKEILEYL